MQAVRRMKTATMALLVLLLALSLASAEEASRHRLSNGVTVITKPASWNRIVAISAVVEAGSKYDHPKLSGMARLTNELLREGTSQRSAMELADFLDRHGIEFRTYTTQDFASVNLVCTDEHFDEALTILAEILTEPAFDGGRLLRLQERTLREIERGATEASRRNHNQLLALLFDDHPYARPVEGTAESIGRITRDRVGKFYSTNYVAGSTVVSIVGNFDEDSAVASLEELLDDYPRGEAPGPEMSSPRRDGRTVDMTFVDVPEARASVGYLAVPAPHKDHPAVRVLTSIIGGGGSARVPAALGDRGADISDDSRAYCFCAAEEAAVVMSIESDEIDECLLVVEREIRRLREEPVSDEELRIARNRVAGELARQGQTNLIRALRLSVDYLATGHVDVVDLLIEQISRVSKDDVLRVANEYLVAPAVAIVRPGRAAGRSDAGRDRGI